jgi:hypothetical protein
MILALKCFLINPRAETFEYEYKSFTNSPAHSGNTVAQDGRTSPRLLSFFMLQEYLKVQGSAGT